MGVGGQGHPPAALHPRITQYPLYRRLGGPQGWSGQVQKISPHRDYNIFSKIYVCIYIYIYTHIQSIYAYIHARTRARARAHTHTHTHTHTHSLTHSLTHSHTHKHTHTHTHDNSISTEYEICPKTVSQTLLIDL